MTGLNLGFVAIKQSINYYFDFQTHIVYFITLIFLIFFGTKKKRYYYEVDNAIVEQTNLNA